MKGVSSFWFLVSSFKFRILGFLSAKPYLIKVEETFFCLGPALRKLET